jgi:hypothetical protein
MAGAWMKTMAVEKEASATFPAAPPEPPKKPPVVMHAKRQIVLAVKGQEFTLSETEAAELKAVLDSVLLPTTSPNTEG